MPADSTPRTRRAPFPLSPQARAAEFLLAFGLGSDIEGLAGAVARCEQAEHDLTTEQRREGFREYRGAIADALRSTYAARQR